jgi:type VI secretion system secreted protein VgrG
MPQLELTFESGESSLDVRRFSIKECVSELFTVSVWAGSTNPDLDLESIIGKKARFLLNSGVKFATGGPRLWSGVCSHVEQVKVATGSAESTYYLRIAPMEWLLTHRRNHRIFQHKSIPDIIDELLGDWGITPKWRISRGQYPKLEFKVQYGESDYAFMCRLLEEAGIAFTFPNDSDAGSNITFADALHDNTPRTARLPFVDEPNEAAEQEFVTEVVLAHEVRAGAATHRDFDFRNPNFNLEGNAPTAAKPEDEYEHYHYAPGGFLVETGGGGETPVADDKGVARHDQSAGIIRARHTLEAERADKRTVEFGTNAYDLAPGVVFGMQNHPHGELASANTLLVIGSVISGTPVAAWSNACDALFASLPYRPRRTTPKPEANGVQSATVVGPPGDEIHTDEFGRVRVEFPWHREGKNDDDSSCWMRVSQGWAGTGYGVITIPRVGQEVLIGFLAGDPDCPMVVGRVYNATQPVPYELPKHKTRSTWKSNSSPGGDGFNEIMFEDLKGSELVYVQAEKNLRKLVKNDETITVGNNRHKLVKNNETETTGVNRTEVTGVNRSEMTGRNRKTLIRGSLLKQVGADEVDKTDGKLQVFVGGDEDIVIKRVKRERVEGDSHLTVFGKRNEAIKGKLSLIVDGDRHEKIGASHAIDAGSEIHLKAGTALVIEAPDITLKGPGGFVRIDAGGVTITGTMVKINSGGSAGSGSGADPETPEEAMEAQFEAPEEPDTDDVSVNGLAQ